MTGPYQQGERLVHHAGSVWEVVDNDLPGDGEWEGGMVALAGDYLIRCVSVPEGCRSEVAGREMRVHRDYLHDYGWRKAEVARA